MRLVFHLRLYSYLLEKHLFDQRGRKRAFLLLLLPRLVSERLGRELHSIPSQVPGASSGLRRRSVPRTPGSCSPVPGD